MNLNKINILKSTYFEYLLNLEVLDLERNEIKSVESSPFKNLTKLKRLILSNNFIEEMYKLNLDGLSELEDLILAKVIQTNDDNEDNQVSFVRTKLAKDALLGLNHFKRITY